MEFQRVVGARRMVRAFQPDRVVPEASVRRILRNAQRGPSAGFSQGNAYVVLTNAADRERFWRTSAETRAANDWLSRMQQAPVLVLCWCSENLYQQRYAEADKSEARGFAAPYWYVDAGAAAMLILQTAVDEGLGACLFGMPPQRVDQIRDQFGVPADWLPVAVIALGYADAERDRRSVSLRRGRRPESDVVHMGRWGSADSSLPS
ncbi:nitroreductase family protein [Cumulibacter soli]|uniref:nitroreductase family protein n=1 Tax=Cumulibacter soli TaxID=2546344 RepID=UPI0010673CBD|nr:nitroreductase family protein [Cumulibacter soli]